MKKIAVIVALAVLPVSAQAQLGKMMGDAAKAVDDAAGKADAAAGTVDAAAGEVDAAAGKADAAKESAGSALGVAEQAKNGVPLTDVLVDQLGVTETQATGGAGAIFSLAKTQMPASDFSQVAAGVPNMDSLLGAAPALGGGTGGMAGAALGAMGGSKLGATAQLASAFSGLGMDSGMAAQFIPICVQYLQGSAGSSTANLLQSVLQ